MPHPSQAYSIAIDAGNVRDRSMTTLPRILPLVQVDPGLAGDRCGSTRKKAPWAKGPRAELEERR
jgi:hypothetical protein